MGRGDLSVVVVGITSKGLPPPMKGLSVISTEVQECWFDQTGPKECWFDQSKEVIATSWLQAVEVSLRSKVRGRFACVYLEACGAIQNDSFRRIGMPRADPAKEIKNPAFVSLRLIGAAWASASAAA
jgi:hypothetical protein